MSDSKRIEELLHLDRAGLAAALAAGHPLRPADVADSRYLGISAGLPGWVDRLAWKTFEKTFALAGDGGLEGWNVRLQQTGWEGAPIPLTRRGAPVRFGRYRVVAPEAPWRAPPGSLLLDYSQGANPALDPARLVRDPIVALAPGDVSLLLGWTYLQLGPWRVGTPSYFLLRRIGPLMDRW